jgi:hypothetical protein
MWIKSESGTLHNLHYFQALRVQSAGGKWELLATTTHALPATTKAEIERFKVITLQKFDSESAARQALELISQRLENVIQL